MLFRSHTALDLLDLKPGQTLVELGSGDGAVLLAAARRGIVGIGYELNPILVLISRIRCWRYRRLVRVYCRSYWSVPLPECDGIYAFLLDRFMPKLDRKITLEAKKTVRFVSYAFMVPGRRYTQKRGGMFLYLYPKG